jgi:Txe/YoeB family toxin of Txe-Axe toxin-antitoxin module
MRLEFKPQAFEDLQYWVQTQPKLAKRLLRLIEENQRNPFWWNRQARTSSRRVVRIVV